MMKAFMTYACLILAAGSLQACASTHQEVAKDDAKAEQKAQKTDKGRVQSPTLPASIFQGYSVTGYPPL
jgi:hypothetical protein